MPVPFGFGVGDFVAVGTLAWNVFKSCKAAPESFGNISVEVLSLHAVLKEGEETLFVRPLPPARAERLSVIKDGCDKVLVDLQSLVQKYQSLGTQSKRTWDRMKWGNEGIAEIRARLTSNATMLTAFISTSQVSVEAKLDKFIEEFQQGKKEGSVVSLQTVDSLSADDRAVWRTIRKELEDIGISVAAFDANRNFIFDWFVAAVETGAFEEQNEHNVNEESNESDQQESRSSDERGTQDTGQRIEQPLARPQPSKSAPDVDPKVPKLVSTRTAPKNRKRVPRVAALLARMSFPRQRLINAVSAGEFSKALMILKDEASFRLLDLETLDRALWKATRQVVGYGSRPLIAELIAGGGNVNYRSNDASPWNSKVNYLSNDPNERTPLWNSVAIFDDGAIVQLLIEKGADVQSKGSKHKIYNFPTQAALMNVPILRLLLSAGVDVNVKYNWDSSSTVTLIHEAAFLGVVPAIEALLEQGAESDAVSPEYGTALMLALSEREEDAARVLLVKGADPNFGAASGIFYGPWDMEWYRTPIEAAITGGKPSLVKLLLDRGGIPDDSSVTFAKNQTDSGDPDYKSEYQEIWRMIRKKPLPLSVERRTVSKEQPSNLLVRRPVGIDERRIV